MLMRFIAGLGLLISVSQTALASEWRYCLAPSEDEHKVYFSGAFATSADAWSTDHSFELVLAQAALRYDDVQCPRADDERSIQIMRRDAVSFNQTAGNQIVNLNWKP